MAMRVAFIMDWHLYYSVELANALVEGHDVMLVARDRNKEISSSQRPMEVDEFLDSCLDRRVRRDLLRYGRLDIRGALDMLRIYREIKAFRPDVLHVQENSDWRIFLIAGMFGFEKVVLTVHDVFWHPGEGRRRFSWMASKSLRERAGKVIVHGDFLKEQFSRIAPDFAVKTFPVHHGSYSIFRQWDDGSVHEENDTVLFFGRLGKYKGIEQLIDAMPLIKEAVPGVRIIIAGNDSAWKEYFGALLGRMKGDPAFEVHNRFIPNEEVPSFFRRASMVAIPYVESSQSGVISVAYAFGKPVVATRVGSIPEVVEDGGTGFLVQPGDHEALAEGIIKILSNGELRRSMAERALRKSETDLSWAAAARKTVEVYRSVIVPKVNP
jgi:glycosyltransferase involved in cell wall biosynthesis